MILSALCIRRPVFALVINILIVVFGIIGFRELTVRLFPAMESATVFVHTSYRGASPSVVESKITTPLEEALSSVEGIDSMTSSSRDGASDISIRFAPDFDAGVGINQIRDKLSEARSQLPTMAGSPVVKKAGSDANPLLYIDVSDTQRSALQLADYLRRNVKPSFQQLAGVGNVMVWGAGDYVVKVLLDPRQMAARKVTVSDIDAAIQKSNNTLPMGKIKSRDRNYAVRLRHQLRDADTIRHLIIRDQGGKLVRLQDLAQVEVGELDTAEFSFRINGKPAVVMAVVPQTEANPIEVSARVKQRVQQLAKTLPSSMRLKVDYDNAVFMKQAVDEVYTSIFEAVILVVAVVFLALGSVRSAIIPIITIPVCLLSTFGALKLLGFSLNNMTLLAIVLAIGLVVDDAIVVLENIYRHIERGVARTTAAITGSQEIGFAIVAMTLTLVAVYVPFGFQEGHTATLFREFAFTLAAAVLLSGFVSLTLSPMMCSRLLPERRESSGYEKKLEHFFASLSARYKTWLQWVLARPKTTVLIFIIVASIGGLIYQSLPQTLVPTEDDNVVFVASEGPVGANVHYMGKQMDAVDALFRQIPERQTYLSVVGMGGENKSFSVLVLKPFSERKRSTQQIVQQLMPQLMQIPGINAFAFTNNPVGGGDRGNSVDFVVQMAGSYRRLEMLSDTLKKAAEQYPGFTQVQSNLTLNSPRFDVTINSALAANLQISEAALATTLSALVAGKKVTEIDVGGKAYDLYLSTEPKAHSDPLQLNQYYVRTAKGAMVPLGALITITDSVGPISLAHNNRLRSVQLSAQLAPGYTLADGVAFFEHLAKTQLPNTAQFSWQGAAKRFIETNHAMVFVYGLALLFIFLTLSAQFESFTDPLIILLTVPFSIVGAIVLLKVTGGSLNIYTQIGFVTLVGLVTKHGILITEFANQLRMDGVSVDSAIVQAACARLRPILMTTAAMVLGALPLALARGPGAISRQQIGWVIVGGMLIGTFFSLFAVPSAYRALKK